MSLLFTKYVAKVRPASDNRGTGERGTVSGSFPAMVFRMSI